MIDLEKEFKSVLNGIDTEQKISIKADEVKAPYLDDTQFTVKVYFFYPKDMTDRLNVPGRGDPFCEGKEKQPKWGQLKKGVFEFTEGKLKLFYHGLGYRNKATALEVRFVYDLKFITETPELIEPDPIPDPIIRSDPGGENTLDLSVKNSDLGKKQKAYGVTKIKGGK